MAGLLAARRRSLARLAAAGLLCAVLLASGQVAATGRSGPDVHRRTRTLAQFEGSAQAAPAAAPAPEAAVPEEAAAPAPGVAEAPAMGIILPSGEAEDCRALVTELFPNCPISIDRISLIYGRGSEQLPTPEEQAAAIAGLAAAGLPPKTCCTAVLNYTQSTCPCSPSTLAFLGEWLDDADRVEPTFLQGITSILLQRCSGAEPTPCIASAG